MPSPAPPAPAPATCCETMKQQLAYDCEKHGNDCHDVLVTRNDDGQYFLTARNAIYECQFCPWCGLFLLANREGHSGICSPFLTKVTCPACFDQIKHIVGMGDKKAPLLHDVADGESRGGR